ncbi:unnamed protein product [Rhizophagus irregularis]|nr:unnamed protein product [Rhizophagus irregularis]
MLVRSLLYAPPQFWLRVGYIGFGFQLDRFLGFGYIVSTFGWALDIWVSFGYIDFFRFLGVEYIGFDFRFFGLWIYGFRLSVLGRWIYRIGFGFQFLGVGYTGFNFRFLGFGYVGFDFRLGFGYMGKFPLRIFGWVFLSDFCQIAE